MFAANAHYRHKNYECAEILFLITNEDVIVGILVKQLGSLNVEFVMQALQYTLYGLLLLYSH